MYKCTRNRIYRLQITYTDSNAANNKRITTHLQDIRLAIWCLIFCQKPTSKITTPLTTPLIAPDFNFNLIPYQDI